VTRITETKQVEQLVTVKTTTIFCDICKNKVSEDGSETCVICKCDVCRKPECSNYKDFDILNYQTGWICKSCNDLQQPYLKMANKLQEECDERLAELESNWYAEIKRLTELE
jgi:hypothetical protein